jgi:hypothetical protein
MNTKHILVRRIATVITCLLLSSCGGGVENQAPPPAALQFVKDMRAHALAVAPANSNATAGPTATTNRTVTADMVLDWAEFKFAELFPKAIAQKFPAVVYEGTTYNARAYTGAWGTRYLGITPDGRIFGLGDFTNNVLQGFETIAVWAAQVTADRCAVSAADCAAQGDVRLSANMWVSVALQQSGDVFVWGRDTFGVMLGSGTPVAGSAARRLVLNASSVSAGLNHFVAVRRDGLVVGWGINAIGELGNLGSSFGPDQVPSPRLISGLTDVRAAAASALNLSQGMTTVVKTDGTVWHLPGVVTPGGPLQGSTVVPKQVAGLSDVVSMASSNAAAEFGRPGVVAITADGTAFEITFNVLQQPGNTTYNATATPILGLGPVRSVSCALHCLFLMRDGRVFARGPNGDGELGNGTTADSTILPVQVTGLSGIRSVAVLGAPGGVSVAVGDDGRLWSWGHFQYLGRETGGANSLTPGLVPGFNDATEVTAGTTRVLFRRADGSVWGWGSNLGGELGDGTTVSAATPVRVLGINLN